MFNKLYEKLKKIISENFKFILLMIITIIICFVELPFYISAPGGVIDISSKINIEDSYKVDGSFNMAYVTEYKATLPMLIVALINNDWDIEKKSDVLSSTETDKTVLIRDHIMLEEANQNAVIYAYKKANKKISILNEKIYVTHIYEFADTNLSVGDQIISINNIEIMNKEHLYNVINTLDKDKLIDIKVKNNNKTESKSAKLVNYNGSYLIGIMISSLKEYDVSPNIKINFSKSESGPSGGLMMSLAIYNYLTKEDITKGYKIAGTGTIDENGNVGSIGGVEYKIKGAVHDKIKYFIIPNGDNYEEALKIKNKYNYDIDLIPVNTFEEALEALSKIK